MECILPALRCRPPNVATDLVLCGKLLAIPYMRVRGMLPETPLSMQLSHSE